MTGPVAGASPRRLAGAQYLVKILGGAVAIGVVPALLFAPDPATTAANIQAHELLYRFGLAAHLVVTLTNIPLAVILYELFKVVNRRLALLGVFFILVATAVEVADPPTSSRPWSCWAANPMRALCQQPSYRRWSSCPVSWRRATTPSTRCSSAATSSASPT